MFLTLLKIFFLNLNNWFIQEKKYQYIKITSDVRCKAHQLESDSLFDTRRIFLKLLKVNIIILLLKQRSLRFHTANRYLIIWVTQIFNFNNDHISQRVGYVIQPCAFVIIKCNRKGD